MAQKDTGFMSYKPSKLENDLLPPTTDRSYSRQNVPRVAEDKERSASKQGVVALTYVQNRIETRQVAIPHNLGFTPICEVWWRDGTAAYQLKNLSETRIYPLPIGTDNYYRWFYADKTNLYILIERRVLGGAGSFTDFYKYFIYGDRFDMQLDTIGTMSTL